MTTYLSRSLFFIFHSTCHSLIKISCYDTLSLPADILFKKFIIKLGNICRPKNCWRLRSVI
jgi:hypothetical protein